MLHRTPSPLALGGNLAAMRMPHVAMRAYLALIAAIGGGVTGVLLMMSVAANSGTEAERIADTQDNGYAATLVSALAVNLSKPLR